MEWIDRNEQDIPLCKDVIVYDNKCDRMNLVNFFKNALVNKDYTHWMYAPEKPIKYISFDEVVRGIKEGKRYLRKEWTGRPWPVHITTSDLISAVDITAEDWYEVKE